MKLLAASTVPERHMPAPAVGTAILKKVTCNCLCVDVPDTGWLKAQPTVGHSNGNTVCIRLLCPCNSARLVDYFKPPTPRTAYLHVIVHSRRNSGCKNFLHQHKTKAGGGVLVEAGGAGCMGNEGHMEADWGC
jgi:hypothetical protein